MRMEALAQPGVAPPGGAAGPGDLCGGLVPGSVRPRRRRPARCAAPHERRNSRTPPEAARLPAASTAVQAGRGSHRRALAKSPCGPIGRRIGLPRAAGATAARGLRARATNSERAGLLVNWGVPLSPCDLSSPQSPCVLGCSPICNCNPFDVQ
ncbi:unnamed protein product [Urochloa humidicola]